MPRPRSLLARLPARFVGLVVAAVALVGCSPSALLGLVAGRDEGARSEANNLAYGEDPRQRLDVYVPDAPAKGGAPVAIFFYGGSWKGGSRKDYAFAGAALASRGFVTFVPDYRLYPAVRFPDFLADSAAALRYAQDNAARFGGDPTRIVLVGHSAGAYNAAMLALDRRYTDRAGVRPDAIRAWAGLSGPYDFLPLDPGTAQEVFGEAPDLKATQPITYVGRASPPAYLAVGEADDTVRPRNTAALAASLRRAGVSVVEHAFPRLDHSDTLLALTVRFRDRAPILDEMTAFLREKAR